MVFDVPAEKGGALTILNQYYDTAIKDTSNDWVFILSTPELEESDNVKVLNFPWVKNSWFHRLYFDIFLGFKLVKKHQINEVISLQNIIVPKVKVKQTLYLHQALPFAEKRYRLIENPKLWIYQKIIGRLIYKSVRKADKVIVQTKWIMNASAKKTNTKEEKFIIKPPDLNIEVKKFYESNEEYRKIFFYPAGASVYKNHDVIVKACRLLKVKGIINFRVIFTINGDENKEVARLRKIILEEDLPIEFIGSISIDKVYEYYSKSILIFPSYLETFGLPLLEARMHQSPIIASDCAFSHEVLDGYDKATFFHPSDELSLSQKILNYIEVI